MEYTNIVDDIPEEGDIVEFKTYDGKTAIGFYTLPYRSYPNSFFDPFKLAHWYEVICYGCWVQTTKKASRMEIACKTWLR